MLNKLFNDADTPTPEGEEEEQKISSLILLPTRELAVQVLKVLQQVLSHCKDQEKYRFRSCLISGGFSVKKQERILGTYPDILIATIGRLWDLIESGEHASLRGLALSDFLVLDEVDRILELGQYKELSNVLKYLEDP